MKRVVVTIVGAVVAVLALGVAPAAANQSGNAAISCVGGVPPGQSLQTVQAAGPQRTKTPPEFAAQLHEPTVGALRADYCTTPAS